MIRPITFFQRFRRDESGAVTVDWVVLAAAVVGLAYSIVASMQSSSLELTQDVDTFMQTVAPTDP